MLRKGLPVPTSTLSDIFKESNKWLEVKITGGTWKKKQRAAQFPLLEDHLIEWVDRANHKHIAINDFILKAATEQLVIMLSNIPSHVEIEDYTEFVISNGWLYNVKQRNALSGKKMRVDGADINFDSIPDMRCELQHQLEGFALQDVFNCDELALQ